MVGKGNPQQALLNAIVKILRPLVRILLRHGVPYGAFTDLAKRAYVDVAYQEFGVPGKKQTNSRVATITGLSRKEIQRLLAIEGEDDSDMVVRYNRAARVVYGWVHDESFNSSQAQGALLRLEGDTPSFAALVKAYSGDVPPRAILDELLRVGVVELVGNDSVRLLSPAYIPRFGEAEKFSLLGRDVAGLISTMDRNIHRVDPRPLFQRKVFYDNLPEQALDELQTSIGAKCQPMLQEFDRWMAAHDRDANPSVEGTGRKAAGISVYYFEEEIEEELEEENVVIPDDAAIKDSLEKTAIQHQAGEESKQ